MNIFVFPNAVRRKGKEKIKLNLDLEDTKLHFHYNDEHLIVDTKLLRNGSSTIITESPKKDSRYVLFNFREILEIMEMFPREFLSAMNQRAFIQIDKSNDDVFIKVFCLEGDKTIKSDTTDFSSYPHVPLESIHELDRRYSWDIENVAAELREGKLILWFDVKISDFWKEPLYVSHGGQSVRIFEGRNSKWFHYVPTEKVYFGSFNSRYIGRAVDIQKLLGKGV